MSRTTQVIFSHMWKKKETMHYMQMRCTRLIFRDKSWDARFCDGASCVKLNNKHDRRYHHHFLGANTTATLSNC